MTPDDMIAVIQAHADGKTIEMRDAKPEHERNWCDASIYLMWDFIHWEYRIKPDPPKPREFWVRLCGNILPQVKAVFDTPDEARRQMDSCDNLVHVREVLSEAP